MLAIFDDTDFPKIRRSIFVVSSTIILIASYDLDFKFPANLIVSGSEAENISGGLTVFILWIVQGYLIYRYHINRRAALDLFDSHLQRETNAKTKAEFFSEQVKDLTEKISIINLEAERVSASTTELIKLSSNQNAKIDELIKTVSVVQNMETQLGVRTLNKGEPRREDEFIPTGPNDLYVDDARDAAQMLAAFTSKKLSLIQELNSGTEYIGLHSVAYLAWLNSYREEIERSPLVGYEGQVSKQETVEIILSRDQLYTAHYAVWIVLFFCACLSVYFVLLPFVLLKFPVGAL